MCVEFSFFQSAKRPETFSFISILLTPKLTPFVPRASISESEVDPAKRELILPTTFRQ